MLGALPYFKRLHIHLLHLPSKLTAAYGHYGTSPPPPSPHIAFVRLLGRCAESNVQQDIHLRAANGAGSTREAAAGRGLGGAFAGEESRISSWCHFPFWHLELMPFLASRPDASGISPSGNFAVLSGPWCGNFEGMGIRECPSHFLTRQNSPCCHMSVSFF